MQRPPPAAALVSEPKSSIPQRPTIAYCRSRFCNTSFKPGISHGTSVWTSAPCHQTLTQRKPTQKHQNTIKMIYLLNAEITFNLNRPDGTPVHASGGAHAGGHGADGATDGGPRRPASVEDPWGAPADLARFGPGVDVQHLPPGPGPTASARRTKARLTPHPAGDCTHLLTRISARLRPSGV